jgi:hypothetical protein
MQFLVDLRFAQNFFQRWKKRVKLAFFPSFARIPRDKQQKAFSSVTWKNVVARATKFSSLACARARCGSVSLQNEPDYVRAFFSLLSYRTRRARRAFLLLAVLGNKVSLLALPQIRHGKKLAFFPSTSTSPSEQTPTNLHSCFHLSNSPRTPLQMITRAEGKSELLRALSLHFVHGAEGAPRERATGHFSSFLPSLRLGIFFPSIRSPETLGTSCVLTSGATQ